MEFLTPSKEQGSKGEEEGEGGEGEIERVVVEVTDIELEGEETVGEMDMLREGKETLVDNAWMGSKVVGTRNGELCMGLEE